VEPGGTPREAGSSDRPPAPNQTGRSRPTSASQHRDTLMIDPVPAMARPSAGTSVPSPARVPSLVRDRCPGQTGGTRPGVRPGGLTL